MDLRVVVDLSLLIISFFIFLDAEAAGSPSVVFFDASERGYIRGNQLDSTSKMSSISLNEVSAAVSVLLGFAPPSSLDANSSAKLNELLLPNPFDRPQAVFVMEVGGVEGQLLSPDKLNAKVGNLFSTMVVGSNRAEIELPGDAEVSVVPLDETLDVECDTLCINKELHDLAFWLGGSYVGSLESLDGVLTVPLSSVTTLSLHVAKKADQQFAVRLVSLVRAIKKALDFHEYQAKSSVTPPELLIGRFTGIEALQMENGPGVIVDHGVELFQTALIKLFELLQRSYGGEIVGVLVCSKGISPKSKSMLDVSFSWALRSLQEGSNGNAINSEVLLVRRCLTWITGIILLISTLIGVYLLLNMTLTRDTLLYSNVKLD